MGSVLALVPVASPGSERDLRGDQLLSWGGAGGLVEQSVKGCSQRAAGFITVYLGLSLPNEARL